MIMSNKTSSFTFAFNLYLKNLMTLKYQHTDKKISTIVTAGTLQQLIITSDSSDIMSN